MKGYIKKQSLMYFCDNTASKTIDNNDIARFPVARVVEVDVVLKIIDKHISSWSGRRYGDPTVMAAIEDLRRDVLRLMEDETE